MMSRLKVLCLALLSLMVVGVMTSAAAFAESSPLPDIHTALPGENYPINLGGLLLSANELKGSSGGVLKGTDISTLLEAKELTSLGHAFVEFLGVTEAAEGRKCHTEGASEANGEVILPNAEWHLVYTALSPGETLEVGALTLFTKFTVTCHEGLFKISVTGPSLSRVNATPTAGGAEGDTNDLEIATHCLGSPQGFQELSYYYNDNLERVPSTLLFNLSGTGNVPGCEEIPGTLLLTPETGSAATMFTVLL
jgi:hypothetical protein